MHHDRTEARVQQPLPAYRGSEPYVFVCYAHADAGVVYPEMRWLQEQGVYLWYDAGISAGAVWRAEIADALRGAKRMLVYLSRASLASAHCQRELDFALDQGIPVLPVYLEEVALPSGLDLALGRVQALRRSDGDAYRTELLSALGRTVASPARPTRRRFAPYLVGAGLVALAAVAATFGWLRYGATTAVSAAPDRSVSIAPFEAAGAATELATGLTEQVTALVSGYQELRSVDYVDPPAASYLLRTNVQTIGDDAVVRPRLLRIHDGATVWSDELTLANPGAGAQRTLARTIARFVRWQLVRDQWCESIKRRTSNAAAATNLCAALALSLQASQQGGVDASRTLDHAQRALALDPSLIESYRIAAAGLLYGLTPDRARDVREARDLLRRANEIDAADPLTLGLTGVGLQLECDLNYESATATLRHAIAVDPLHPTVHWLHAGLGAVALQRGQLPQAIGFYRRAVNIFDGDARIWYEFSTVLASAHHFEEAIAAADEGLGVVSRGPFRALLIGQKAFALTELGKRDEAERLIATTNLEPELQYIPRLVMRDRAFSERWLETTDPVTSNPTSLTLAYITLDRHDDAFANLHRGIDERDTFTVRHLRTSPLFDPLRSDPRWQDVMRHLEREEARGEFPAGP